MGATYVTRTVSLELKIKLQKGIWLIGKGACLQNKIEQVRFLHSPQRRSRFF